MENSNKDNKVAIRASIAITCVFGEEQEESSDSRFNTGKYRLP
jgi:hypothetical protein